MGRFSKFVVAASTIVALPISSAQAACWSETAVSAAKVRDLETMLMVSALRCRATDKQILSNYNTFIKTSRTALTQVNDTLRNQFAGEGGLNAYDRYVTAIANRYGAGAAGLNCRDMASILSAAQSEGGSSTGLARLADDAQVQPVLTGRRCTMEIAGRK